MVMERATYMHVEPARATETEREKENEKEREREGKREREREGKRGGNTKYTVHIIRDLLSNHCFTSKYHRGYKGRLQRKQSNNNLGERDSLWPTST